MKNLIKFIVISLFLLMLSSFVFGQGVGIPIECGSIIQADFVSNLQNSRIPGELYNIELNTGDRLEVTLTPLSDLSNVRFSLFNPDNFELFDTGWGMPTGQPDTYNEIVAPSPGIYTIRAEADIKSEYMLEVGCVLRDGTIISPGDAPPVPTPNPTTDLTLFDYLGLSDKIANGVIVPLQADVTNAGSIAPAFPGIFGYSFSAEAGQTMSFDFTRTDGNLNLGVVLLSGDNQVAFQASLVTSNTLSTELTIPASGEYTLGVFRIELIPPDAPENTTFTLTGSLN